MDRKRLDPASQDGGAAFAARLQRIRDAIELREPDRVPYYLSLRFWPARQAGLTYAQAMYDTPAMRDVTRRLILEFQPDLYQIPNPMVMHGPTMARMDFKTLVWPGHGVDEDVSYQYIDKEIMTADEYEDYLFDPTGYYLQKYLPRIAGVFKGFAEFPRFGQIYHTKIISAARAFGDAGLKGAFEDLAEAGRELDGAVEVAQALADELADAGFPLFIAAQTTAPFDLFADYYRGSKGAMLDMYRRPDTLLEAMEKARVLLTRDAIEAAAGKPGDHVFIPLHWGLDGFMSPAQFDTFFWPQLRRMILDLIDADLVPYVFWEGDCEKRLESIADIPPGKAIYKFEQTDMFKAKEILGGTVCIQGNVPASLFNTATPGEMDAYCKKLIEGVAPGGGFILDGAVSIPDEAKYENVVAFAEAAGKYGA